MRHRPRPGTFLTALVLVAAATGSTIAVAAPASPAPGAWLTAEQWARDLAALDAGVRAQHADPFARTPESAWKAQLAEAAATLPGLDRTAATAEMIRLVAHLDGHSGIFPDEAGFRFYCQQEWSVMADGVYVTAAEDPRQVGARILGIGDEPMDVALARMRPYINADNESGAAGMLSWMSQSPELLQAAGIIDDPDRPDLVLRLRDGTVTTAQLRPTPVEQCGSVTLARTPDGVAQTEAIARREEPVWWAVDPVHRAFVLADNQPGASTADAVAALTAALDAGDVDRVVVDLRYASGGAYISALHLVLALAAEPRINRPDRLAVLIGRDTFSAGAALASAFEQQTQATFVGEPTGGRPNTFLDETTFTLPESGLMVHVPTNQLMLAGMADHRDALYPDLAAPLLSSDVFAGHDRALELAVAVP